MTTLHFESALLPTGWASDVVIEITDGAITSVRAEAGRQGHEHRPGVAIPGMINLHSHAFQRGMAGLTERAASGDDSFWTWREMMYLFLERLTPDDVEDIARLAFVEMGEAGFTSLVEFHYLHHAPDGRPYANLGEMAERIAAAVADTGLGLTLLPVLYRHGNFGKAPAAAGQRRFLCDLDRYDRLLEASARAIAPLPSAVLGLAPHSLRAAAPEDLAHVLASRIEGPIHIHAAEQEKEVADCRAWSGKRPVEWLLDEVGLGPRWCLIHATHMTEDEARRLAASGAVAGLCPLTEANLGDGFFPADLYRRSNGWLGIGTDSNIEIDAAAELKTLEYNQRLLQRRRNRLAEPGSSVGRTLFDAALAGGSRASGRPVGALAPGRRADIVVLDPDHPSLAARVGDRLLDGFIFATARSAVREVWIGGQRVVEGGEHVARRRAVDRFRAVLERVLA